MNCSRMWRRPCSRRRTNYSTADQPSPQCSTCSTSHLLTISRPFDISSWFVFVCLCPAHRSCQGGVNVCCKSCPRFPHIPWFMDSSGQSVQTAKVPRFTNSGHTGTMCPPPQPVFAPGFPLSFSGQESAWRCRSPTVDRLHWEGQYPARPRLFLPEPLSGRLDPKRCGAEVAETKKSY